MHPNFTMLDTEELNIGDFDPTTYQHILPKGAHDYDDYDSNYEEKHPELGFTDKQVEAEAEKLNPEDKKFYEEYRDFLDAYYRQHGRIIELSDLIKLIMTGWYPEIPSTTKKEQNKLCKKLMIETRKREMCQQARLEEEPPRKIRRVVPEMIGYYRCYRRRRPGRPNNNKNNTRSGPLFSTGSGGRRTRI